MGNWYRVTKTIKGHQYHYEQRTYREGKHVRTLNRYIGSVSAQGSSAGSMGESAVTTTGTGILRGVASFGGEMLKQVDIKQWGVDASAQLGLMKPPAKKKTAKKRRRVTTTTQAKTKKTSKKTWFRKNYEDYRAIGDVLGKRKIFLGYIEGKKYYSVGKQSKYWNETAPEDEVWDFE
jgi:hypothetical protein